MLSALVSFAFPAIILYLYGRWFHENREHLPYYVAPIGILAVCLLIAGAAQSYVFGQAIVESYSTQTGLLSDSTWQEPRYQGEDTPIMLALAGPIAGFILLLVVLPRTLRKAQSIHYLLLLLLVYPVLAIMVLSTVGGDRPRFYSPETLPALGTRVPTTQPTSPALPHPSSSSEQGGV